MSGNRARRLWLRWQAQTLWTEQSGRCIYCDCRMIRPDGLSRSPRTATVDHITPRAMGGRDVPDNLILACWDCNSKKANMSPAEWLARLGVMV